MNAPSAVQLDGFGLLEENVVNTFSTQGIVCFFCIVAVKLLDWEKWVCL